MVSNLIKKVGLGNNNLGHKMDSKSSEFARKATMRKIKGTILSANLRKVNNYFSQCTYFNIEFSLIISGTEVE